MTGIIEPEGYCAKCRFVVALDDDGLMSVHIRNSLHPFDSYRCDGSRKKPARDTPYRSKLSAFSTVPLKGRCPRCFSTVTLKMSGRFYGRHYHAGACCGGSGMKVD